MVHIDLDIQAQFIKPSREKVFLFKDKNHEPDAPKHFYICLPTIDDNYVCLVMSSSQCGKIKSKYREIDELSFSEKPHKCSDSLIELDENSGVSFITRESVVNCNTPKYGTLEEIKRDIDKEITFIDTSIPDHIYERMIEGVRKSPIVKKFIRRNIANIDS